MCAVSLSDLYSRVYLHGGGQDSVTFHGQGSQGLSSFGCCAVCFRLLGP